MTETTTTSARPRVICGIDGLRRAVSEELGVSTWHEVTQAEVSAFAEATHDFNWIHVDRERAANSPLGGTIAHGLYTLSLGPMFNYSIVIFEQLGTALHYGYNRVRFPALLRVGSSVRMRLKLIGVTEVAAGVQATFEQTFECQGADRPVCVAEFLMMFTS